MKKVFDDPSVFDEDDMPCRCDCGNWFDLHDGYGSLDPYKRNILVCQECHELEERERYEEAQREADEELNEIDDYEEDWDEEEDIYFEDEDEIDEEDE